MTKTVDMTVGNPTKHILTFALPLLLANFGQQMYTIVDAAIVGRGVGVQALAAAGATDWCYWLILWTVMGLTQGFSTFVSRSYGNKDYKQMNKVIATAVTLSGILGTTLTLAGLFAARLVLNLLNTPSDIIEGATVYLTTMVSGTLIVTAYNMSASVLRALGDGKSPLIAMAIAGVMNIGLDCLFVLVLGWGILGVAIASIIAQAASFLYCLLCLRKVDCIDLPKKIWKPDWKLMMQLVKFGIPMAMRFFVVVLGGIILQSSVNLQGSNFVAGYTATNKLYGLLECSATSLGIACCTFLAQNYGAGQYDRVKQGVKSAFVTLAVLAVIIGGVSYLLRQPLLRLFLDVSKEGGVEALGFATRYLTITLSMLIALYMLNLFENGLQALGISVWSMWSGVVECVGRVFMGQVALGWIGADAIFYSEPVAWIGGALMVLIPFVYYTKTRLSRKVNSAQ